jgi:aminoglycoside phosphotransferase (APT) family kinase protein
VTEARERGERGALTHGEPHPGNVIGTDDGWLLVDWDTAAIAQPERDLWFPRLIR